MAAGDPHGATTLLREALGILKTAVSTTLLEGRRNDQSSSSSTTDVHDTTTPRVLYAFPSPRTCLSLHASGSMTMDQEGQQGPFICRQFIEVSIFHPGHKDVPGQEGSLLSLEATGAVVYNLALCQHLIGIERSSFASQTQAYSQEADIHRVKCEAMSSLEQASKLYTYALRLLSHRGAYHGNARLPYLVILNNLGSLQVSLGNHTQARNSFDHLF